MVFKGRGLKPEDFNDIKPISKIETRCIVERNSIKWQGKTYKSDLLKCVNNEGVSVFIENSKLFVYYKETKSTICSFEVQK